MPTYTLKPGAADPLSIQPVDDSGQPEMPDAMQMRIDAGGTCISVDGVEMTDAFDFDLNSLTLDPRLYRATIYSDWGNGWIRTGTINLMIEGGC